MSDKTENILGISIIREGDIVVENKLKECKGSNGIYPFDRDWKKYREGYKNGFYPKEGIKNFIDTLRGMTCSDLLRAHEANVHYGALLADPRKQEKNDVNK